MKFIYMILVFSLTVGAYVTDVNDQVANAQDKEMKTSVTPHGKSYKFSDWFDPHAFKKHLESTSKAQYPVIVEAKPILGDGVQYRLLNVNKPSAAFKYEMIFGVKESVFLERQQTLLKQGYTLIQHQIVQLMAIKAHQAVWVKSK